MNHWLGHSSFQKHWAAESAKSSASGDQAREESLLSFTNTSVIERAGLIADLSQAFTSQYTGKQRFLE